MSRSEPVASGGQSGAILYFFLVLIWLFVVETIKNYNIIGLK